MTAEKQPGKELYRSLSVEDLMAIATLYNLNNDREETVWCRTSEYEPSRVLKHVIKCMAFGDPITQVHEVDDQLISYFCGWIDADSVTYDVGVVNINLPDFFDIWRKDTAELFKRGLQVGKPMMRIKLSTDDNALVSWIEKEVGMTRMGEANIWEIESSKVVPYTEKFNENS